MGYLETLKNISKDKKKKRENLIFILVLLVILLISVNYIFKPKEETEEVKQTETKSDEESIEEKIASILNEISGVSEAHVIINYSNDGNSTYAYDTKETTNENGATSKEKNIAYNEENGSKTAIVEMYNTPQAQGVIIVASGVENVDIKQKISSAVGNLLGIASYKVQVFEK